MKRLDDLTEPQVKELMSAISRNLGVVCINADVELPAYALILCDDKHGIFHVTNCEREGLIKAFRAVADDMEQGRSFSVPK